MKNWRNLTKEECAQYMRYQMSPRGGYDRSGSLPEDCGWCGGCGTPTVSGDWCSHCREEFELLKNKLRGYLPNAEKDG